MIKLIIFARDDTLNIDVGFTYKLEDLKLVKNAKKVCDFIKQNKSQKNFKNYSSSGKKRIK